MRVPLLINERKDVRFARALGLTTITVPGVAVALFAAEVISDRSACRKLES